MIRVESCTAAHLRCVLTPGCVVRPNELRSRFGGAGFLSSQLDYKYLTCCFNVLLEGSEAYTN